MGRQLIWAVSGILLVLSACTSVSNANAPLDAGTPPTVDAGPPPLPCGDILACLGTCQSTDTTCDDACVAQGTTVGQQLFTTLQTCVNTTCSSAVGGACNLAGTLCDTCLTDAQASGGACYAAINSCDNDTSGGGTQSCNDINNCLGGCAPTDLTCQDDCVFSGTSAAQVQFGAIQSCFATTCPTTAGGVCATETTDCDTCITDSQNTGAACASVVDQCESASVSSPSGCNTLLGCLSACAVGDTVCQNTCLGAASATAQSLYNAAANCVNAACPDTTTGVCASETTACTNCYSAVQATGGTCESTVSACQNN